MTPEEIATIRARWESASNAYDRCQNSHDVPLLLAEIDSLTAKLATARADAMETACRAVCIYCARGDTVVWCKEKQSGLFFWVHAQGIYCSAGAVRRAFAETEEAP